MSMTIQQPNTTHRTLNPIQLTLLKLFSRDMTEQETVEIRNLLMNYLDAKLQRQVDIDIEKKGITQTDLDNILNNSQRTPLENASSH